MRKRLWKGSRVNSLKLDQAGEDLIKGFETLRLEPYLDQKGIPTQGWGHTENVTMDSPAIDQKTAEKWFQADVAFAVAAVNRYVTVTLTQNEFNSLVSFAFNEGTGRLLSSTLLNRLNHLDRQGAGKEFDRWVYYKDGKTGEMVKSTGLINRRAKEKALFLKP